ncbi:uncharacterized protein IL334_000644 [Kwoniella shivajii]|uniref:BTB domain-containing protein n=1 Tax=Kwoniella shivajii TaxID=564305 RepID=A0ABZ1CPZ0_9TREE|nr:hypothetical protein IL334_000644 [Kwoniella shivajii]
MNKIHAFHRYGDLRLRSDEGTIFRVDSQRLADISPVFDNMLELPQPSCPTGNKRIGLSSVPIDLAFSSNVLEIFFELLYSMKATLPSLPFSDALSLYEFCEMFDIAPRLKGLSRKAIISAAIEGGQWALLIWSADRNDLVMAREALRKMTNDDFLRPQIARLPGKWNKVTFWSAVEKLPLSWQTHLLRLTLHPPSLKNISVPPKSVGYTLKCKREEMPMNPTSTHHDAASFKMTQDWASVASLFMPPS